MSKRIITMIMIFIMVISIGSSVFATGTDTATETETTTETSTDNTTTRPDLFTNNETEGIDPGIPEVDIDDVTEWTDRKGHQIITMIQRFAQPFTIIIFIGCAILTLIGAFGDSRMISKGIYGMFISVIVYAVILNADKIMDLLLNFLMS